MNSNLNLDQTLLDLEDRFFEAELHGDQSFFETYLAEDFLAVGPRGFTLTKDQWIDRHRSGDLKNISLEPNDIQVRRFGSTAIVTSTVASEVSFKGQEFKMDLRGTHVFVQDGDGWKFVHAQASPIQEPLR